MFPVATRFTTANAREMARRAVEARRLKRLAPPPVPPPVPAELFALDALNRVRDHLRKVDNMLQAEQDPLSVERLARARLALCEQEFALAGRPKPGQRRPGPAPEPGQVQSASPPASYKPRLIARPPAAPNTTSAPRPSSTSPDLEPLAPEPLE